VTQQVGDVDSLLVGAGIDRATAGALAIGSATATAITVGSSGVTPSFPGGADFSVVKIAESTGNTAALDMTDGGSASASSANHGRLRYNETSQKFEKSENGSSYAVLGGGFALSWGSDFYDGIEGYYAKANDHADASPFDSLVPDTVFSCPIDCTITSFSWNTEGASTDTVFKILVAGTVQATVTCTGVTGSAAVSVSASAGDGLAIEWDSGTRPRNSMLTIYAEPA
jgi:hypothetical protein